MIIPINDKLRIRGTELCWNLEKAITRKGKPEWMAYKFFKSLTGAVGEACQRDIRLHPATGLTDAIQAVDEIVARYARIFDEALNEAQSRRAA
ncbi:MAG: hypothetical protein IIA10_02310 [Proteobacteria bacterium]|nr:hypothetical protein [Pseudomonadota bacterium]